MFKKPLLVGLAFASLLGSGAFAAGVDLLSHRAAYRLSLHNVATQGGISAVRGALVMEWRASCEGWISNQRLGFVADTNEGGDFVYDVRFSSWESLDHKKLRFNVRSFDGGTPFEEFRGQAMLEAPGKAGIANYIKPQEDSVELPAGTIFPTLHMNRLVEAAQKGQIVINHEVFDGSGPDALSSVSAFIGEAKVSMVGTGSEQHDEEVWPVRLAYYSGQSGVDTPDFQISFGLTAQGVLYDIILDYGDFALQADLEEMETFETPKCD